MTQDTTATARPAETAEALETRFHEAIERLILNDTIEATNFEWMTPRQRSEYRLALLVRSYAARRYGSRFRDLS
jgi:hypothetical protein